MNTNKVIRMRIDAPATINHAFRVAAAERGVTLKTAIVEAISMWIAANSLSRKAS
jgi:hypothetical protein